MSNSRCSAFFYSKSSYQNFSISSFSLIRIEWYSRSTFISLQLALHIAPLLVRLRVLVDMVHHVLDLVSQKFLFSHHVRVEVEHILRRLLCAHIELRAHGGLEVLHVRAVARLGQRQRLAVGTSA